MADFLEQYISIVLL